MSIRIQAAVTPKVGFASHQNAVPILRELELVNESTEALEDLQLSIEADPPFLESKRWRIERLDADSSLT